MTDDEYEKATISWLASRGYLITKLEAGEIPGTYELPPERPLSAPVSLFDDFWALYPRKVGKEAARKIFNKLAAHEQRNAVHGVQVHIDGNAFSNEKCYIKHPSTWLTQKVYLDEPENKGWTKPQIGGKTDSRKALDAFLEED